MNLVNAELPCFCPRENCSHFQDTDNLITKAGTYQGWGGWGRTRMDA